MRISIVAALLATLLLGACSFGAAPAVVDVTGADGAMDGTTLDIGTAGSIDPVD